jgi:predicted phosphoribosyltransferase
MIFEDRRHAGRVLADKLQKYRGHRDIVVLALPRGGVPVGHEVAEALGAPLDVFVVRKLGVPGREELAMGAIASGGVVILNSRVVSKLEITRDQIEAAAEREMDELRRREAAYGENGSRPPLRGRTIILVDDGLATGSTMQAAIQALRRIDVGGIVVAVPVSSPDVCAAFEPDVDEIICARRPDPFFSVGTWYRNFTQVTDDEVRALLRNNRAKHGYAAA